MLHTAGVCAGGQRRWTGGGQERGGHKGGGKAPPLRAVVRGWRWCAATKEKWRCRDCCASTCDGATNGAKRLPPRALLNRSCPYSSCWSRWASGLSATSATVGSPSQRKSAGVVRRLRGRLDEGGGLAGRRTHAFRPGWGRAVWLWLCERCLRPAHLALAHAYLRTRARLGRDFCTTLGRHTGTGRAIHNQAIRPRCREAALAQTTIPRTEPQKKWDSRRTHVEAGLGFTRPRK